jgi:error-prone DNA polymerase
VIARGKLSRLVPIENAGMPDRCVIQWDKDDLEALGLLKVDVLALGMLSAIRRGLEMVSAYHGRLLRMQDVPAEDPAVYEMIGHSDTVGVPRSDGDAPRLKPQLLRPGHRGRDCAAGRFRAAWSTRICADAMATNP